MGGEKVGFLERGTEVYCMGVHSDVDHDGGDKIPQ